METIFHIILGLLGLSFIILIHELGHFAAAKCCKVHVERLCLFLGKPLFCRKWGATEFAIAWLPLGGYCKMKDEGLVLQGRDNEPDKAGEAAEGKSFQEIRPIQKIFIAAAGPFVNILFAFIVLFLFQVGGHPEIRESNRIVVPNTGELENPDLLPQVPSPAEQAGLQSGDEIVQVGNQRIDGFRDLRLAIALSAGETLTLEFLRDGERLRGELRPAANKEGRGWVGLVPWRDLVVRKLEPESSAAQAGIKSGMRLAELNGQSVSNWYELLQKLRRQTAVLSPEPKQSGESGRGAEGGELLSLLWVDARGKPLETRLALADIGQLDFVQTTWVRNSNPWQAGLDSVRDLGAILSMQIKGFAKLFGGGLSLKDNLAGPVQISDQIGRIMTSPGSGFAERWYSSWQFLSLISFMIALANLLPLAVLDGGQILLHSVELLARRPLPRKWVSAYQSVGSFVIISLMVLVFSFELMHYVF
ncbi:RIP metalloprotease RseP [Candidatus Haliotispira prima]|uniref:Zinc metalloprotease n=1 Tax=Candidatus Haliotispira prima TaxID=3034016 RepID=A0ABY8MJT1_9SPIO|nr:RIP metalloprotease RseP [Candidatus Haliotispira prima]